MQKYRKEGKKPSGVFIFFYRFIQHTTRFLKIEQIAHEFIGRQEQNINRPQRGVFSSVVNRSTIGGLFING